MIQNISTNLRFVWIVNSVQYMYMSSVHVKCSPTQLLIMTESANIKANNLQPSFAKYSRKDIYKSWNLKLENDLKISC